MPVEQYKFKGENRIDHEESKTDEERFLHKAPYSKRNSIEAPHKDPIVIEKGTHAFNPRASMRDGLKILRLMKSFAGRENVFRLMSGGFRQHHKCP